MECLMDDPWWIRLLFRGQTLNLSWTHWEPYFVASWGLLLVAFGIGFSNLTGFRPYLIPRNSFQYFMFPLITHPCRIPVYRPVVAFKFYPRVKFKFKVLQKHRSNFIIDHIIWSIWCPYNLSSLYDKISWYFNITCIFYNTFCVFCFWEAWLSKQLLKK